MMTSRNRDSALVTTHSEFLGKTFINVIDKDCHTFTTSVKKLHDPGWRYLIHSPDDQTIHLQYIFNVVRPVMDEFI